MNEKKIRSLCKQIESAYSVSLVDENVIVNVNVFHFSGITTNEILKFDWEEEGLMYEVSVTEEALDDAVITEDGYISVLDTDGRQIEIELETSQKIVVEQNW